MKLPLPCGLGAAACGTGGFTDLPGGDPPPSLDRGASHTPPIEDGPRDLPHNGQRSIHVWIGS